MTRQKAEYMTSTLDNYDEVVGYIRQLGYEKTETTYDNGLWLNRVEKITIKKHKGLWKVTQTLHKNEVE